MRASCLTTTIAREYEQKDGFIPFSHPLDLHYSTSTIEGWPQISVRVWTQDKHGRNEIGTHHTPTSFALPNTRTRTDTAVAGLVHQLAMVAVAFQQRLACILLKLQRGHPLAQH